MDYSVLVNRIRARGITCLENEPMRRHTTFRIGGEVAVLALPKNEEELIWLCGLTEDPLILGNGSNLLVSDAPLQRLAIKTTELREMRAEKNRIFAGAGVQLARVASFAADHSLTGLEFAHGIPGTLGGAILMNAGAYGGEMVQVMRKTRYLDENLQICEAEGEAQGFAYRESIFSKRNCVILGGEMELSAGDPAEIRGKMDELMQKRKTSQPLDRPSAGSTFKRPKTGYAAALIDQAGLKGCSVGGAQVSEKHAGFVINTGGATFSDVLQLMAHIQKTVFEFSGVELTPEVRIIGG